VTDSEPEGSGTWTIYRRCLLSMPDEASHLLILQDDALPCEDFHAKALAAVAEKPDDVLVMFLPAFGFLYRRALEAKRAGERFVVMPSTSFVPVVTTSFPRMIVERLLAWDEGETWPRRRSGSLGRTDDGTVAAFCRATRLRVLATVPSLADHRADVPSIARPQHRAGGQHRRAALFE